MTKFQVSILKLGSLFSRFTCSCVVFQKSYLFPYLHTEFYHFPNLIMGKVIILSILILPIVFAAENETLERESLPIGKDAISL